MYERNCYNCILFKNYKCIALNKVIEKDCWAWANKQIILKRISDMEEYCIGSKEQQIILKNLKGVLNIS